MKTHGIGQSSDEFMPAERAKALAVEQIERNRRFHTRAFGDAAVAVLLVVVRATTEYNNAGGWPTSGFSQCSGIPHEWNDWIVYPLIALAIGVAIDWGHT